MPSMVMSDARACRQRGVQRDVDRHRAVLGGRRDAATRARHDAVVGVDAHRLAKLKAGRSALQGLEYAPSTAQGSMTRPGWRRA